MRNWRQVHGSAAAEYYIETGKPSSAPLGAMGKGLEAANNVNTGTSIVALLADHERACLRSPASARGHACALLERRWHAL